MRYHLSFFRLCAWSACAAALAAPVTAQDLTAGDILAGTHVHGLALDAKDPMRLLVATHHGLFAVDLMSKRAEAVTGGPIDFMGFSADPGSTGTFLASGHPAEGGNLGVIRSIDEGVTWEPLASGVGGPVDFHQMDISKANPSQVWGVHHGAILQRSRDGGENWEEVGFAPAGILDIAASARDPEMLFAATETGLLVSRDGGLSWEPAHPVAGPVSVVDVSVDGQVVAFVLGEGLVAADEAALEWEVLGDAFAGSYPLHLAPDASNSARIIAATGDGRLMMSITGGRDWTTLSVPAS